MTTAVIWDCDGVLVDSEKLSCSAWLPVLRRRGIEVELADIEVFIGRSDPAVLEHYRHQGHPLTDDILLEREQEYYAAAEDTLGSFDGLQQVLADLHAAQTPIAVASSGGPERIRFSIEKVGIAHYFEVICSAAEVANGKPAPDLFLLAAQRLGIPPADCLVIEDSVPGVEAAVAAGMRPIGFTSSHAAQVLESAGAHTTFSAYAELPQILKSVS
ncbi:MAG: HAD family phosphatase [Gemmatimonadetes bacterium]|nr:HAD family phosphatase [Gemmatimonadota bacterium]MBT5142997.1 HAD family phosphatase [Gemmatimonadota bacterium]MBT5588263.1 HAD family phosphatase [Gemmatimonadota bacterium]MBT5962662.1 HAD family phosphatase [Gemmatimonadota bacterium]MBT6627882.1 HAD family phosphatase [Gemmatimonadota bacterium]